jgi:hypothetical protein
MSDFSNVSPAATPVLSMWFGDRLGVKTIQSATWDVLDDTGTVQASLKIGTIDITGAPWVRQQVGGLTAGRKYLHRAVVTTVETPNEKIVGELFQMCQVGA